MAIRKLAEKSRVPISSPRRSPRMFRVAQRRGLHRLGAPRLPDKSAKIPLTLHAFIHSWALSNNAAHMAAISLFRQK